MARERSYATSYEKTMFARRNGQLLCPSMQEHDLSHLKSGSKKDCRLETEGQGQETKRKEDNKLQTNNIQYAKCVYNTRKVLTSRSGILISSDIFSQNSLYSENETKRVYGNKIFPMIFITQGFLG